AARGNAAPRAAGPAVAPGRRPPGPGRSRPRRCSTPREESSPRPFPFVLVPRTTDQSHDESKNLTTDCTEDTDQKTGWEGEAGHHPDTLAVSRCFRAARNRPMPFDGIAPLIFLLPSYPCPSV